MKFLIDENLSRRLVDLLVAEGHDTVHVRQLDATGAPDTEVLAIAAVEGRVIVSADTDFGALLAHSRATEPSVILVRALVDRRPPVLAGIIGFEPATPRPEDGAERGADGGVAAQRVVPVGEGVGIEHRAVHAAGEGTADQRDRTRHEHERNRAGPDPLAR